jgi:hypothetical protein
LINRSFYKSKYLCYPKKLNVPAAQSLTNSYGIKEKPGEQNDSLSEIRKASIYHPLWKPKGKFAFVEKNRKRKKKTSKQKAEWEAFFALFVDKFSRTFYLLREREPRHTGLIHF